MALDPSPHYRFITAAKAALEDSDSDIGIAEWRAQKLSIHTGAKWLAGAYLSPLLGVEYAGYENATDRVTCRTVAAIVRPTPEADGLALSGAEMQKIERVENIFRNATGTKAPASIQALRTVSANWDYEITRIESADRFIASAAQLGYDACATVLATDFVVYRSNFNFSGLGSA